MTRLLWAAAIVVAFEVAVAIGFALGVWWVDRRHTGDRLAEAAERRAGMRRVK